MNRPSPTDRLLAEVLADVADDKFRNATLQNGVRQMRRKYARRRAWRASATGALLLIAAAWLTHQASRTTPQPAVSSVQNQGAGERFVKGTSVQIITDEQLLDLFKGRPVALVGAPGRQKLVLLDQLRR